MMISQLKRHMVEVRGFEPQTSSLKKSLWIDISIY